MSDVPSLQVLPISSSEGFWRCSPLEPLLACLQPYVSCSGCKGAERQQPREGDGVLAVLLPIWGPADTPPGVSSSSGAPSPAGGWWGLVQNLSEVSVGEKRGQTRRTSSNGQNFRLFSHSFQPVLVEPTLRALLCAGKKQKQRPPQFLCQAERGAPQSCRTLGGGAKPVRWQMHLERIC